MRAEWRPVFLDSRADAVTDNIECERARGVGAAAALLPVEAKVNHSQ